MGIQPYVYAFSSLCVVVGAIWDISWHATIGRDSLFAPPHMVMYLGAIVSGLFSGLNILKTTFFGSLQEKQASVKFWGIFYGSLGSLFSVWGAIAMLTSAPFDDWWHNAYGLDVIILSPPHALLAAGFMMIQFGALVAVLSSSKLSNGHNKRIHSWLFAFTTGLLISTIYTLFSEQLEKSHSHGVLCYQVASIIFPVYFVSIARATPSKWAGTRSAAVYMLIQLLLLWILPLFPAVPRLAPVLNHVTHYQPFYFPLLLIIPAFGIDMVLFKLENKKVFVKITLASLVFLGLFFVVQWNVGTFLHTAPVARGWFFGSYTWAYRNDPNWKYRYAFHPHNTDSGLALIKGMVIAALVAVVSGLIGYKWGGWMRKVQR
jgi:hypothetical protein